MDNVGNSDAVKFKFVAHYLRWHHGTVKDPKFKVAAKKSGRSLPDVIAVFAFLAEHASEAEPRGCIESFDNESCDALFDFPDGTTNIIRIALEERNIATPKFMINWAKRNPIREDPDSAARKREQRLREQVTKLEQQIASLTGASDQ